jgi:hypothetical protein
VRLRNIETSKAIIGLRVGRAASRDGGPDARLDQFEPPQDMDQ